MFRSQRLVLLLLSFSFVGSVAGQTKQKTILLTSQDFQYCSVVHPNSLYCLIPTFGSSALSLPATTNSAGTSFSPGVQTALAESTSKILQLNGLLGIESATLTLPSPATGISFTFDPTLGVVTRSVESLGPIVSDRAETLGAHKVAVGFAYQHFNYDELNGHALKQNFDSDSGINNFDLELNEFTTFVTVGVTRRIDVSVVIPVREVHMAIRRSMADRVDANLYNQNLATLRADGFDVNVATEFVAWANALVPGGSFPDQSVSRTGLSDIAFRLKAVPLKGEHGGVALGVDIRTPTGDPVDFLGSGAVGVKPFVAVSGGYRPHHVYIGPFVSTGFEWNGSSILGGETLGASGRLPRRWLYSFGTEVGLGRRTRTTLDLEFNGQRLFSALRSYDLPSPVFGGTFQGQPFTLTSSTLSFSSAPVSVPVRVSSINLKDGSVGAKVNLVGNLLVSGNLTWRLDRAGLRARMVPLVGISYTF